MNRSIGQRVCVMLAGTAIGASALAGGRGGVTGRSEERSQNSAVTKQGVAELPGMLSWQRNPALEYWRLWETSSGFHSSIGTKQNVADESWKPDEEMTKQLVNEQAVITGLMEAANASSADWGIRVDQGIGALLPHLGKLRASSRVLRVDARRLVVANDPVGAMERVAAILRMRRHVENDAVIISALVGQAITLFGIDEATLIIKANPENKEVRAIAIKALKDLPTVDPFGVRQSVVNERTFFVGWLRTTFASSEWKAGVQSLFPADAGAAEQPMVNLILAMDQAALLQQLEQFDAAYGRMIEAWDSPNAEQALESVSADLVAGKFGLVAQVMAPALVKTRKQNQDAEERVRTFRELLTTK
jgi:hypothetical protein